MVKVKLIRVANVVLDKEKKLSEELRKIKGLNKSKGRVLCGKMGIGLQTKVGEVKTNVIDRLNRLIKEKYLVGVYLDREVQSKKGRHSVLKTYKGLRYSLSLPVNGQRTKTNSKTAKKQNKKKIEE